MDTSVDEANMRMQPPTTAACYGIEHFLRILQEKRRQLEQLWVARKIKLEANFQKVNIENETKLVCMI